MGCRGRRIPISSIRLCIGHIAIIRMWIRMSIISHDSCFLSRNLRPAPYLASISAAPQVLYTSPPPPQNLLIYPRELISIGARVMADVTVERCTRISDPVRSAPHTPYSH